MGEKRNHPTVAKKMVKQNKFLFDEIKTAEGLRNRHEVKYD